jgi:Mg2+/Co2+ transporter CorB
MNKIVLSNVFASLDIMWKGMLGLFIVCGGVAVLMMLIAKIIQKPKR